MIRLRNVTLPATAEKQLDKFQTQINNLPTYVDKVAAAKTNFSKHNTAANTTFKVVRATLTKMCSGSRRCCYCEDSAADEVEHIKPKDLYPEEVFMWGNYLYACGPCNGPKNNKFAVFSAQSKLFVDVTRGRGMAVVEPEAGAAALINPRWEDPLSFMELDLLGTFLFLPTKPKGSKDYERAEYTIKILRLNEREVLRAARREAYGSYEARLSQYVERRDRGEAKKLLTNHIKALKRMQHPTVWREMKRQQMLIQPLKDLFNQAPEALKW